MTDLEAGQELDALITWGYMPRIYAGICQGCGTNVTRSHSDRYCSRACYVASRWTQRTCGFCKEAFKARISYVARGQMTYCSPRCAATASRKRTPVMYAGDTFYLDVHGYLSSPSTGRKMHRVVWATHFGPISSSDDVVHHRNGIKTDNRIENLVLMSRQSHATHHDTAEPRLPRRPKTWCATDGCGRQAKARGLCTMHYQRVRAAERGRWL
jgi:hypothetical protein